MPQNSFIISNIFTKKPTRNQRQFLNWRCEKQRAELYKRERERLVHWATHERGSFLAHIFPKVLVHEREWMWLTIFAEVHSF